MYMLQIYLLFFFTFFEETNTSNKVITDEELIHIISRK